MTVGKNAIYLGLFLIFIFFFLHINKYVPTNDIYLPLFMKGKNRNAITSFVGVMNM